MGLTHGLQSRSASCSRGAGGGGEELPATPNNTTAAPAAAVACVSRIPTGARSAVQCQCRAKKWCEGQFESEAEHGTPVQCLHTWRDAFLAYLLSLFYHDMSIIAREWRHVCILERIRFEFHLKASLIFKISMVYSFKRNSHDVASAKATFSISIYIITYNFNLHYRPFLHHVMKQHHCNAIFYSWL